MKRKSKRLIAMWLCLVFVFVLAGCTSNVEQETPQETTISAPEGATTEPEAQATVTLTIDPNFEGQRLMSATYPVGSEVDLSKKRYFYSREGYNRDLSLYYDAECQKIITDNKFVIEEDTTVYIGWTKWSEDEISRVKEYFDLMAEAKEITMRPKAWSGNIDAFHEYGEFIDSLAIVDAQGRLNVIDNPGILDEIKSIRNKLVQTTSNVDEDVWYIWGDDIPNQTKPSNFYMSYDAEDFKPFLIPYLAEDQSKVKGNMIVISGGAFFKRANMSEAYPTAEFYQANGYNAFVLQYRVAPYGQIESNADLQRAIRYIKSKGEALGLAHPERVSAVGFSAGGMNINGVIDKFDPDRLPTEYFPDYKSDEIDQANSALDAGLIIYGAMPGAIQEPETKQLPEMFFVVSEKDTTIDAKLSLEMYMEIFGLTRSEFHLFADGIHGIGLGTTWNHGTYTAYSQWGDLSLTFLDITYGYQEPHLENE